IEGDPGNAYWLDQIRKSAAGELPVDDPNYDLVNRLVVITPQYGTSCLHILDGERMEVPERLEEDLIRELIPYSDINRVLVTGEDVHLPSETWGAEPPHDWCYTFQRGSLFRQAGEYEQVVALYEQAEAQGHSARDRVEWLPFIEAYTALGQYDRAYQLVRRYEDVGQRIPRAQIQSCHQQTPDDMIAVMECIRQPSESVVGYPVPMMWGEDVRLHDWQVVTGYQYQACDTLEFESVWSTDAPIDHIYSFSLILASTDGVGLIHAEGAPAGVTPLWKVDVPYTDRRTIALPCDLPAGEYLLLSGLSDTATNTPLGSSTYLTTISVGNP
ncbi:MAG: tetratricopeptide repeat protein, partial [Phototrophicaceae bacterium]